MHRLIPLLVSVSLCVLVGVSGSLVTAPAVRDWYPGIEKPSWNPPDSVFGPVWSTLYVSMGVAAWLVWRADRSARRKTALIFFALQLVLNGFWSLIFFGLRSPGWAFVELVLLWSTIVATVGSFWKVSRPASILLLPYLGWVSFAAALNFAIWTLNR